MHDPVTLLIRHHVIPASIAAYETWLKAIAAVGKTFDGHGGVSIIRPHGAGAPYSILLRFDTHENLKSWISSATRRDLLEQVLPMLAAEESQEIETGLEFWFTPPSVAPLRAKPYKQFLLTLSAIYPLTLIVPKLMAPILQIPALQDRPYLGGLLVVIAIVALMVYVIMPRYTRLMAAWLFR